MVCSVCQGHYLPLSTRDFVIGAADGSAPSARCARNGVDPDGLLGRENGMPRRCAESGRARTGRLRRTQKSSPTWRPLNWPSVPGWHNMPRHPRSEKRCDNLLHVSGMLRVSSRTLDFDSRPDASRRGGRPQAEATARTRRKSWK